MDVKETLAQKIAGEITLSPKPGKTIRKWRNTFGISQTELANSLGLSPSVISDYESGRRKSPGIQTIKRIIHAFIALDESQHNRRVLRRYQFIVKSDEGILDIKEYPFEIPILRFINEIHGKVLTSGEINQKKSVKGYTLIDSIKTITSINSHDYARLYGWSTERAMIFTGIKYGRGAMIAIRIHPVKPSLVVYQKPGAVDPLAIELAERDNIPLVITNLPMDELQQKLNNLGEA